MVDRIGEITRADFRATILRACPEHLRDRIASTLDAPLEERAQWEIEAARESRTDQLRSFREQARANSGLAGEQWLHNWAGFRYAGAPADKDSQASAMRAARALAEDFPEVTRGLCLWGRPGRGKDYILDCIANHVLQKKAIFDVRRYFGLDVERRMYTEFGQHSEEETRMESIMRGCDLLLIADLHDILSCKTDQIARGWLRVIDQIERTGRPILCATSNEPQETFDKHERLGSRLAKIMTWLEVTGPDRRRMI